tara:strand:+ start:9495 stop:10457 length:963 start_codon:yes stop_codon:yes gene_type:complete
MIQQDEIISVKRWMSLGDCNYEIDHDDDSIPESGVVYCNIEHIHKFFAKCDYTDNKYVVVSAFSDYGVAIQEENPVAHDMLKWIPFIKQDILNLDYSPLLIAPRCEVDKCKINDKYSVKCYSNTYSTFNTIPKNVVKWFAVNPMTRDDRITAIPLGVGKDAASDICFTATNPLLLNTSDRVNWVYANWQLNTLERNDLMMALDQQRPPWATIVLKPKSYLEYLSDLSKHSFAMCPRGNGVDCYRVLECLYCNCIPIVKDEIAYDYLEDLPHVRVKDWQQINIDFLKEEQKRISKTSFNMDKIKLEFWKNKIEEARGLLNK